MFCEVAVAHLPTKTIQGANHVHPLFRGHKEPHEATATCAGHFSGQGPGLDGRIVDRVDMRI